MMPLMVSWSLESSYENNDNDNDNDDDDDAHADDDNDDDHRSCKHTKAFFSSISLSCVL